MKIEINKVKGTYVNVSATDNRIVVDVSTGDIRKDYEKEEVLAVVKKLEKRDREIETESFSEIKFKISNVRKNCVSVLMQIVEGNVYVAQIAFDKLEAIGMSKQAKLGYPRREMITRELWKDVSKEERSEKFEQAIDAWDRYQEEQKEEENRELKEKLERK